MEPATKRCKLEDDTEGGVDDKRIIMEEYERSRGNGGLDCKRNILDEYSRSEEKTLDGKRKMMQELERNEMDKLKEFLVLDEVEYQSGEDQDKNSDSNTEYEDEECEEVPDDEIEAMLEEGLPEDYKGERKRRQCPYDQRQKLVLEEKGINHFEVLPLGWLEVLHTSGMPIYLHKQSRVCTLAKPYFLGPGSARKHEIPVSAIPCLNYRRALEDENKKAEIPEAEETLDFRNNESSQDNSLITVRSDESSENVVVKINVEDVNTPNETDGGETVTKRKVVNEGLLKKLMNKDDLNGEIQAKPLINNTKVETAQENWAKFHLKAEDLTEYCKTLFKFKTINIMKFKSWSERRKFMKIRKAMQRPTLPDGTKLITFPVQTLHNGVGGGDAQGEGGGHKQKRECLMNPSAKSYVCILHEYLQRALRKQPTYEFKELENGATPYSATVSIDNMKYGIGYGMSKRSAKSAAAKAAIEILIPEMREKITQDSNIHGTASRSSDRDLAFFDDIAIEDPRVADFCAKTMEPSPHTVLQTCLDRNFGIGDREIKMSITSLKPKVKECTMTVGKHNVTVTCKNKKHGKQRASQAILQALHPNIHSWGSLLRLYGTRSVKSFKEKKQEEQQITLLQSKAAVNQPNYAILSKLQEEMSKLYCIDEELQPIGRLVVEDHLPMGSTLNNVNL